jgi:two-component system cell cycle response regulator
MAKATILLVEDSKVQAQIARKFLEINDYEVMLVEDGMSAIKVAKKEPVDLILLDLMLPDIDGNEVCRCLKADENTKGIPIIMLTVKDTIDDKVLGLESGAADYLSKPFKEVELNARIYASLRAKALQDELREKNRQLEQLLQRVEYMAMTDPLTGLYNRRHFQTVIKEEFKQAVRYDLPLSCLMIDIDRFKEINDVHGHRAGDEVLKAVSGIFIHQFRDVDVTSRWGGEEFIMLCNRTDKNGAVETATRIREVISESSFPPIPVNTLTVSIGIAGIPDRSIDTAEKLIHAADVALYAAKANGRNRVEVSWQK